MARVRYLTVNKGAQYDIKKFPNFSKDGSVKGMKDKVYGKDALLVQCDNYIYNVTYAPEIYDMAK